MKITYALEVMERKTLVKALALQTGLKPEYLGMPSAAYQIGNLHVAKDGTLTGPDDHDLIAALRDRHSFVPTSEEYDAAVAAPEKPAAPEIDQIVIEMPLTDFTPEALDRLNAMVAAKEALIKKALGAEELPIQVLEDRIAFPWFSATTDGAHIDAYAQFIAALCKTAREKKRVTAKAPEGGFENEAFAMRVFLIGLGLIGPECKLVRVLLGNGLSGSSAWRYGPPEKAPVAEEAKTND